MQHYPQKIILRPWTAKMMEVRVYHHHQETIAPWQEQYHRTMTAIPTSNGEIQLLNGDDDITTQKCKRQSGSLTAEPQTLNSCGGVFDGNFGAALSVAGRSMLNTGHRLLQWARQPVQA